MKIPPQRRIGHRSKAPFVPGAPPLGWPRAPIALALALGLGALSCGEKLDPVQDRDGSVLTPTWCADVQPIVQGRCLGCHSVSRMGTQRNGAPTGVNFDTYEDASRLATAMDDFIQSGVMPPSGLLPDGEREIFGAWVDTGRPEGVCE